jgi:tetratricopeptide (TPR) repeat protein
VNRAHELDPLSLVNDANLGRFLYHARRYDEAIDILTKTLQLDPNRAYVRVHLALCYEAKGMYAEALREFRSAFADRGPGLAHLYAMSGEPLRAKQMVTQLRHEAGDSDWFFIAGVYAALGDRDEAIVARNTAYMKHDFFLVFLEVHPYMDPLRSDPRYSELVHRIGLDSHFAGGGTQPR